MCDCPPMHAFPQVSYLWPARALFRRAAAAMTAAAGNTCAPKSHAPTKMSAADPQQGVLADMNITWQETPITIWAPPSTGTWPSQWPEGTQIITSRPDDTAISEMVTTFAGLDSIR